MADKKDSLDPCDVKLAGARLAEGLDAVKVAQVRLELKYPISDPQVAAALNDLRRQVLEVTKSSVTLELVPLSPYDLRKAMEAQDYQLIYRHYDYPDETYALGPLLGQDGNNELNYRGTDLQALIQGAAVLRQFDKVRERVRTLQGVLDTEMPLIPLWQLDPLSAYRERLKPGTFDPLLVFTDAESWRLERK